MRRLRVALYPACGRQGSPRFFLEKGGLLSGRSMPDTGSAHERHPGQRAFWRDNIGTPTVVHCPVVKGMADYRMQVGSQQIAVETRGR